MLVVIAALSAVAVLAVAFAVDFVRTIQTALDDTDSTTGLGEPSCGRLATECAVAAG